MTLPSGDQTAIVLAAEVRSIERAVRDGVLTLEQGNTATETGKAFEEAVREKLDLEIP